MLNTNILNCIWSFFKYMNTQLIILKNNTLFYFKLQTIKFEIKKFNERQKYF